MAFVHGSQNRCYTSRWFDKFTLNKYWHGDFLLSCMCFPDLQPSSAYSSGITNTNHSILVCYFYIPPPMGNSGWQFIKTCTRQGRSSWWSKSDIEHICPSACVLHSDLSFNAICDAVMCAKGQSIEKLKSVPVQQLSDNIKNELTKDFDYLLIECDGERRQKVTNIECRLFVLVDKYQLSDSHQVAKLEKSVDPEASLSNALLLKDWGHEFLRRLYEYGSIDLNQFAQCFYSSYWYTSQNSSNAWPLPNLNFDLGYAELIGRLNGLLRLLLYEHNVKIMSSDGITDRTEHIYDCVHTGWEPFEPESRLLDSLWRFSSTHSSAIVPITTKDVWRVREIFFYSWGKFKGDEDNKSFYSSDWSVQLEPNTTVICGVSNSGKTTILRALELACLLMTCGLSPSENYCFDENNNTLPPWLHTKLVTLCNCFTKDCSPLSPEILWHKGSDLALIPIFRVVFTHISGTNVTFQLNANGESYAATKINYTLSKSDECVDIEYLYLNLSAEIECGDHTYSLGEESKECIKPSRVDELLEPLVQLVGYNRSLALLTEHVNRFFPIYQFGIEMDPNFCCEKVNSMIELRYSNGSSDRIWDELKYALCITVDSSVQTSDLTKFGEGFLHILRIIIKSLMLKHQVRCSPKLLLLDEPDQSVDRLTLPLLADFLLHQDPSIQCVLTTHSYELIVHASDLAHESESNVGVRHLTYYGIIETSVEQVLRELHCADTFQLMRYIPTERMLHIFIVENTSDEAILTAFISAFGSSEEKTIWKEREKFTLFYLHTRATYEIMLD